MFTDTTAQKQREAHRIPDEFVALVARRFSVLGDPMRLRLLHSLSAGERSVGALVKETHGTQANVSRHLSVLAMDGILKRRKKSLQVFYSIANQEVVQVCKLVCQSFGKS